MMNELQTQIDKTMRVMNSVTPEKFRWVTGLDWSQRHSWFNAQAQLICDDFSMALYLCLPSFVRIPET